jgi:lysophospholipase L1-like esterase
VKILFRLILVLALVAPAVTPAADATNSATAKPSLSLQLPETDDGLPGAGPIRRYPWFRNLWSEKRTKWAADVQQDQKALVFLGDSITQGWGDNLGGNFTGVKTANRGISGDTTRGVLIRLKEDVLALHPTGVVLLIGTNDLEEGADPETIAANLKLILAELHRYNPAMPVVLCEVFPSSATKKRPADKIKQINQLYRAIAKADPKVTLLDTWTLFANDSGDAKPEEFPDLLHPNPSGYAKWAQMLRPALTSLGFAFREGGL